MEQCKELKEAVKKQQEHMVLLVDKVNELPLTDWFKSKVLTFIVEYECKDNEPSKY